MDLMARRRVMMINKGSKVANLWNMNSPSMTFTAPGFTDTTKQIAADGTLTINISSSGNSSSRIMISLTAEQLGLIDGKTYTVKIWATQNNIATWRDSVIRVNAANTTFRSSPFQKTWIQSGGNIVQVGNLYWNDYSPNALCGLRVMVAEGDHIDDFVPYAN